MLTDFIEIREDPGRNLQSCRLQILPQMSD